MAAALLRLRCQLLLQRLQDLHLHVVNGVSFGTAGYDERA